MLQEILNTKPELAFCHLPLSVLGVGSPVLSVAVFGNLDASANLDPFQGVHVMDFIISGLPKSPLSICFRFGNFLSRRADVLDRVAQLLVSAKSDSECWNFAVQS